MLFNKIGVGIYGRGSDGYASESLREIRNGCKMPQILRAARQLHIFNKGRRGNKCRLGGKFRFHKLHLVHRSSSNDPSNYSRDCIQALKL